MMAVFLDWLTLVLRWSHVVAAIAWIGSSFYFIALDFGLRPSLEPEPGVAGEAWQVHGGGFYRIRKYLVAPARLPEKLTWFMWEAYSTWLLGFGLLVFEYYLKPQIYLIDPHVIALSSWGAVTIGLVSLGLGWVIYDALCRSPIGRHRARLAGAGLVLLFAASAFYLNVFSGRGAYLHVGALVGTIMVGNVFWVIIPNQRKITASLLAGEAPAPELGKQSKERSLHNNYLTLPVVFVMLSSHYPFTFSGAHPLLILTAVFVVGFLVRHHFNSKHLTGSAPIYLFPSAAAIILVTMLITSYTGPSGALSQGPAGFPRVRQIVAERCQTCHATNPTYDGITEPPLGIAYDTDADLKRYADRIHEQAVVTKAMPLGNVTHITDAERAAIDHWFQAGAPIDR